MADATRTGVDRDDTIAKNTPSDMNPPVVQPLSKADPSVSPDWNEHVEEYFNQDAYPGEAVPMATHETKK